MLRPDGLLVGVSWVHCCAGIVASSDVAANAIAARENEDVLGCIRKSSVEGLVARPLHALRLRVAELPFGIVVECAARLVVTGFFRGNAKSSALAIASQRVHCIA